MGSILRCTRGVRAFLYFLYGFICAREESRLSVAMRFPYQKRGTTAGKGVLDGPLPPVNTLNPRQTSNDLAGMRFLLFCFLFFRFLFVVLRTSPRSRV